MLSIILHHLRRL